MANYWLDQPAASFGWTVKAAAGQPRRYASLGETMNVRIQFLVIASLLTGAAPSAWADNPSSVLQAVTVKTASGTLNGFTAYSTRDAMMAERERAAKAHVALKKVAQKITPILANQPTPDELRVILMKKAKESGLWFLPNAFRISRPRDMIVTTGDEKRIPGNQVLDIQPASDPLNGFVWYGLVNRIRPEQIELLKKEPVYSCKSPPADCCSIDYWLSYNEVVGPADLDPACKGEKKTFEQTDVIHLQQTTE